MDNQNNNNPINNESVNNTTDNNVNDSLNLNEEPFDATSSTVNISTPKKSKAPVIIGATVGTVAVAGVAAACVFNFVPSAKDWLDRKTTKPEEYFAEKEKENVKETIDNLTEELDKTENMYSSFADMTFDVESLEKLEIPAGAYDISYGLTLDSTVINDIVKSLGAVAGDAIDTSDPGYTTALEMLSSFKSLTVKDTLISDGKGLLATKADLLLNDSSVLTADLMIDIKNTSAYIAIPTVSPKYIKYSIAETELQAIKDAISEATASEEYKEMLESLQLSAEYSEVLSKNLAEIITTYSDILIEGVKGDVELKENVDVEFAGEKFSLTEMTTKVTADDLVGVAKDALEKAKDDENIIEIIEAAELPKDDYTAAIESALAAIDSETVAEDASLDLVAWTDKKGNVVGHKIDVEGVEVAYATIEADDNNYASIWVDSEEFDLAFDCVSNGKDGETGTVTFEFDSEETGKMSAKFEYKDYKVVNEEKGLVNFDGKLSLDLGTGAAFGDEGAAVAGILNTISMNIKSECTETSQKATCGYAFNDKELFAISLGFNKNEDTSIKLPADSDVIALSTSSKEEDYMKAAEEYATSINLVALKDGIKKSLDNAALGTLIDTAFATAGLDALDGTQSVDEMNKLMETISSLFMSSSTEIIDDEEIDLDYEYDYEDVVTEKIDPEDIELDLPTIDADEDDLGDAYVDFAGDIDFDVITDSSSSILGE